MILTCIALCTSKGMCCHSVCPSLSDARMNCVGQMNIITLFSLPSSPPSKISHTNCCEIPVGLQVQVRVGKICHFLPIASMSWKQYNRCRQNYYGKLMGKSYGTCWMVSLMLTSIDLSESFQQLATSPLKAFQNVQHISSAELTTVILSSAFCGGMCHSWATVSIVVFNQNNCLRSFLVT